MDMRYGDYRDAYELEVREEYSEYRTSSVALCTDRQAIGTYYSNKSPQYSMSNNSISPHDHGSLPPSCQIISSQQYLACADSPILSPARTVHPVVYFQDENIGQNQYLYPECTPRSWYVAQRNSTPSFSPYQQLRTSNFMGRAPFHAGASSDGVGQNTSIPSASITPYPQWPSNVQPHFKYSGAGPTNHVDDNYLNPPSPVTPSQDEEELPMWCLRRLAFDGELYPPGVGDPSVGTNIRSDSITAPDNSTAHITQPSSILAYEPTSLSNLDEINYSRDVYSPPEGAPISLLWFNAAFGTHNTGIDYDPVVVQEYMLGPEVHLVAGVHPSYAASNIPVLFSLEEAENGCYAFKGI